MPLTYIQGASLADATLRWEDYNGDPVDLSTGYTFSLEVGPDGFTKSSGITGTSTGVTVQWATAGELVAASPGIYSLDVTATRGSDSRIRKARYQLQIIEGL